MSIPNSTLYSTPVACAGTRRPLPFTFSLIVGLMRKQPQVAQMYRDIVPLLRQNFKPLMRGGTHSLRSSYVRAYKTRRANYRPAKSQSEPRTRFTVFLTRNHLIGRDLQAFQWFSTGWAANPGLSPAQDRLRVSP